MRRSASSYPRAKKESISSLVRKSGSFVVSLSLLPLIVSFPPLFVFPPTMSFPLVFPPTMSFPLLFPPTISFPPTSYKLPPSPSTTPSNKFPPSPHRRSSSSNRINSANRAKNARVETKSPRRNANVPANTTFHLPANSTVEIGVKRVGEDLSLQRAQQLTFSG